MITIGFMTKREVNAIIKQFPSNATIRKSDLLMQVITPKGDLVFSAALFKSQTSVSWHVRAAKGLIQTTGV